MYSWNDDVLQSTKWIRREVLNSPKGDVVYSGARALWDRGSYSCWRSILILNCMPWELQRTRPGRSIRCVGLRIWKRTAADKWKDAVQWKQAITLPKAYGELEVQECKPELFKGCDIIFSGLDSGVAKQREMEFLKADFAVFSNAKDYRQDVGSSASNRYSPAGADLVCSQSSL